MAVSASLVGKLGANAFGGEIVGDSFSIDWLSDTIKVALLTNSATPNQDTDEVWSDLSANEVSGTGYTAGGATLGSKTVAYNATGNVNTFDAADVTWSSSTITARYAVIYKDTGTPSTSPIIGVVDFGTDEVSSAGNFVITWNASGIFTLTVS